MEEEKIDYHDANSFPLNELDQTTSTTNLTHEKKQRIPLKPVVKHYLKALIATLEPTQFNNFNIVHTNPEIYKFKKIEIQPWIQPKLMQSIQGPRFWKKTA